MHDKHLCQCHGWKCIIKTTETRGRSFAPKTLERKSIVLLVTAGGILAFSDLQATDGTIPPSQFPVPRVTLAHSNLIRQASILIGQWSHTYVRCIQDPAVQHVSLRKISKQTLHVRLLPLANCIDRSNIIQSDYELLVGICLEQTMCMICIMLQITIM